MENTIAILDNMREFTKFPAIFNLTGEKVRCLKEPPKEEGAENTYFVYAKGKKRRGHRFSKEAFAGNYTPAIPTAEEETEKWHKRIKRVLKEIDKTGLWKGSDMEKTFRNLLSVSLSDKKEIEKIYWHEAKYINGKRTIDEEKMKPFMEKYPFMFQTNQEDELTSNPKFSYIDGLSECKLKSTYFGKGSNARHKERIRDYIARKENLTLRAYTNYDVTFEMDFDREDGIPRAWYSEEYKGCGNGHYYLAVSETCAVFCEND